MKNKTEIMKSVNGVASKAVMKLKKHSPEILVVAGIAGTVVSAVLACKATTKVKRFIISRMSIPSETMCLMMTARHSTSLSILKVWIQAA